MEIRIEHLSMTYPSGKQALKDLNLELKAPSLIGLLGPNVPRYEQKTLPIT